MQYVRSSVSTLSTAWNSINPATLSGAIDVIVVEQEDGSLACSPFHIRFGKWRLLRPYEKKVEFRVNGQVQELPMKLGEGGEAFFVFETQESVPEGLQTSPLVSPATSPEIRPSSPHAPSLQEPEPLELGGRPRPSLLQSHNKSTSDGPPLSTAAHKAHSEISRLEPLEQTTSEPGKQNGSQHFADYAAASPRLERNATDSELPAVKLAITSPLDGSEPMTGQHGLRPDEPASAELEEERARMLNLSKKLWVSNISNHVTDSGDLMLDLVGEKGSEGEALQAEVLARQLLSEEFDGPYDIGSLIGADEKGNLWIYRSEEAKEAAAKKVAEGLGGYHPTAYASTDALSDPGYHSDDANSDSKFSSSRNRRDSDSAVGMSSQPSSPGAVTAGDPNKNYAKTLRLTTDQLKQMDLKSGANTMSFTVNRATCHATLWYWRHDVPIVISDIDGTITKSDVLGHVLNTLGRDWTHQGVAKLYTDIAANGYNFLYLTSRSVGQADTTKGYLEGVVQDGYKLPRGPVILSPDRTIAALRREVYLRKPEIFKMACLRDIMALFAGHGGANNTTESAEAGLHPHSETPGMGANRGRGGSPFYAGFGNRLTDALSYRSVNIPSTRIFTINSNSEVSLDLLSLNNYKTAYAGMREIVDHYFPPVGLLVQGGGEEYTDFNYWRDKPLDVVDFTDSESEDEDDVPRDASLGRPLRRLDTIGSTATAGGKESLLSEDEAGDEGEMEASFFSEGGVPRDSLEESVIADEDLSSSALDEDEADDEAGKDSLELEEDADNGIGAAPVTPQTKTGEWLGAEDVKGDSTPRRAQDVDLADRTRTPTAAAGKKR